MKAILVLDEMPVVCYMCPLDKILQNGVYCGANGKHICKLNEKASFYDRPDWCPLKELPERMDWNNAVGHGATDTDYVYGWNDCLNMILGEEG